MRIKPLLTPDHDAVGLRKLMDSVSEAAAGRAPQQLTEMDYGGGRSPHGGHGLPRDDDDEDAGKPEVLAKPATVKKTQKDTAAALTAHLDQAYKDKPGVAEGSLEEFAPAPGDDGGDDDDDGFDEATLKRMAAHWYQGDEDPRIEQLLAAAGWEIGQDEGYEDEPGVFVVMSGDENGRSYISWPATELQGVTEGSNDGKEDNFTIDDIKRLEQIRDFETLKVQAKELIKGKPVRRMKPEKISWFYNHIDSLKNPLAVIKMMYDLLLAGEGHKVIGSKNSMSGNSYRQRFGEQGVAEAANRSFEAVYARPDGREYTITVEQPDRTRAIAAAKQELAGSQARLISVEEKTPVSEQAEVATFKAGDRVMYMNTFATVVAQDGDAYGIRIDGKPGTIKVPASQIKKPSYDESVTESIDPVEQLRADIRRFAR